MILALLGRSCRETRAVAIGLATVLMAASGMLAFVLPTVAARMGPQLEQLPFIRNALRAALGVDTSAGIGPGMFEALAWAHPVVLAVLWAGPVITCTRIPAGEVEKGTVDVLMSLPVSRWKVWIAEGLAGCCWITMLLGAMFLGNTLGRWKYGGVDAASFRHVGIVVSNTAALSVAVLGMASLASSMMSRKGRAMLTVFVVLLASFLLNYIGQFWQPAERFVFLSVLHYYRPLDVLSGAPMPWRDVCVLLAAGVVMWTAGGVVFNRRDLCAT